MTKQISSYMQVTKHRKDLNDKSSIKVSSNVPKPNKKVKETIEKQEPIQTFNDISIQDHFIPTHIYDTVKYKAKHQSLNKKRDEKTNQIMTYLQKWYIIPSNLERDYKYGPYSGLSYDRRVIKAYALRQLKPKETKESLEAICITCATIGHSYKSCPDGF